jgi:Holliday junction DNA helicase RuvB
MVGQDRVVNRLRRAAAAAASRKGPVPHILLAGPPGLGKTTLAQAVAAEAGTGFRRVAAPAIREPAEVLELLTSLKERDVLFIDEIHRLPPAVAETLYEGMAEGTLSLPAGCGAGPVRLKAFTLIGATTEDGLLPEALRSRFAIREHLEFYRPDELAKLIHQAASESRLEIDAQAAGMLAAAARESPREALALLDAARDEAAIAGRATIDAACAAAAIGDMGIDASGLRPVEREYLEVLARAGGPIGLGTLAGRLGLSRQTVQQVCEPYLLRLGLIRMTPFGRTLTEPGAVTSRGAWPSATCAA